MNPLTILGMALVLLVLFGVIIYGVSGTFFFSVAPPFIEQAATYEFRDHLKQSFYEQER